MPRSVLMTIYKAFMRPHLYYDCAIYDEAYNKKFYQKLESVQYNACIALSGAIRGSPKRNVLPRIRLAIPPTSTLVQETLRIL